MVKPTKKRIWLIAFGILAVLLGIGVMTPILMSDGTDKFSGVQKEVAINALVSVSQSRNGIDKISSIGQLKLRVEEVTPLGESDPCQSLVSTDPNDPRYYKALVSHKTFFGIQGKLTLVTPCEVTTFP